MEALLKTLPAIIEAAGDSPEVVEAACFAAWKFSIGEGLSRNATPVALIEKKLVVAVADVIWQKQLQPLLGQFLFRLNSILGQPLVTFIELRIDPERVDDARAVANQKPPAAKSSEQIPFELLSSAAVIQDPVLRKAFLGAAVSCTRRLEEPESQSNSEI
jgi:hypothetical protein